MVWESRTRPIGGRLSASGKPGATGAVYWRRCAGGPFCSVCVLRLRGELRFFVLEGGVLAGVDRL